MSSRLCRGATLLETALAMAASAVLIGGLAVAAPSILRGVERLRTEAGVNAALLSSETVLREAAGRVAPPLVVHPDVFFDAIRAGRVAWLDGEADSHLAWRRLGADLELTIGGERRLLPGVVLVAATPIVVPAPAAGGSGALSVLTGVRFGLVVGSVEVAVWTRFATALAQAR